MSKYRKHQHTMNRTIKFGIVFVIASLIMLVIQINRHFHEKNQEVGAKRQASEQVMEVGISKLPVGTYTLTAVSFVGFESQDKSTARYTYSLTEDNGKKYLATLIMLTSVPAENPGKTIVVTAPGKTTSFYRK
jgi:hypothetical protein